MPLALRALFPLTAFKNAPNPKFVPAIVFLFQSGGLEFVKNLCKKKKKTVIFRTNFFKFLTNSSPPDWNTKKQLPGQILDKFGVWGVFESCKGEKGSQLWQHNSVSGIGKRFPPEKCLSVIDLDTTVVQNVLQDEILELPILSFFSIVRCPGSFLGTEKATLSHVKLL